MVWSYSGDPSQGDKDAVRFLIQDVDEASPLVSDEEIAYTLTLCGSPLTAAIRCLKALVVRYSQLANKSVGDLSIDYTARAQNFRMLAKDLEKDLVTEGGNVGIFAGGISVAQKDTEREDTDRVPPSFKKGITDNDSTEDDQPSGVNEL